MEFLKELLQHADHAHWYLLGAILLAGLSVPISADLLVLIAAVLAATVIPEHTTLLFGTLLVGCYLSALLAYAVGRFLGAKLEKRRWFHMLLPPSRLAAIRRYYNKYGLWVLIVGRFIPFGVRNCIFMSSGMSRLSIKKFMLIDAVACTFWYTSLFTLFFELGKNFDKVWSCLKVVNLFIVIAFGVTVIALVWYKHRKKRKQLKHVDSL